MTVSTILQSKILKTKKKLSDDQWGLSIILIGIMSVMVIMSFAFRSVTISGDYAAVSGTIPVMSVPPKDHSFHRFMEKPTRNIDQTTPTVVLTTDAFYFGALESFSNKFSGLRNKFKIIHADGAPVLGKLLQDISRWQSKRVADSKIRTNGIVVFVPTGEVPQPIVIQVMAALKKSSLFDTVILGSGMM